MCIPMNYNHSPIVLNNSKYIDEALFTYNPVHLPINDSDYLHTMNELLYKYRQHEKYETYENIMYIFAAAACVYGIYYFTVHIIESIYKK